MEKELDLVVKATQTSLGKYVKRPPLSEKLLRKPPFRFLHDIVTNVLKTTGFFEGLFDEVELVSDNVKDRESKIIFLNKVIAVVGLTTGKALSVKPSKIVAGQEPDKTNELLQCLAQALDKKLSSTEAVKKYKEGATVPKPDEKKPKDPSLKPAKKASDSNKLTSKSNEKLTSHKKDSSVRSSNKNEGDKSNTAKSKQKEKTTIKTESPPKTLSKSVSKKLSIEKKGSEERGNSELLNIGVSEKELIKKNHSIEVPSELPKELELDMKLPMNTDDTPLPEHNEQTLNSSYTIIDNLNSSLSSQDLMERENDKTNDTLEKDTDVNVDETSLNYHDDIEKEGKNSLDIHTVSSNAINKTDFKINDEGMIKNEVDVVKSPTKIKNIVRPLSVRPSSSRPGAPRLRDKHDNLLSETDNIIVGKVNIIVENAPNEEEEDTSIIIIDRDANSSNATQGEQEQLQASLNQHGHLVQQILKSQKEYSQMSGKTEIEWEFGAQKARDAINKEIEQLRFDIQALSRVSNPLGKLLDHIQEDVEVMRQELQQWTKTYEESSKELLKQKLANENSLFPLFTKVKKMDADIVEKHDKIDDLKIIIHKNSLRIEKLLSNGNVQ